MWSKTCGDDEFVLAEFALLVWLYRGWLTPFRDLTSLCDGVVIIRV